MSSEPRTYSAPEGERSGSLQPGCAVCGTGARMGMGTLADGGNGSQEVGGTCATCVAESGMYSHCGEPMTLGREPGSGIHGSIGTESPEQDVLDVYLRTRVVHCQCGYQIEIPLV